MCPSSVEGEEQEAGEEDRPWSHGAATRGVGRMRASQGEGEGADKTGQGTMERLNLVTTVYSLQGL